MYQIKFEILSFCILRTICIVCASISVKIAIKNRNFVWSKVKIRTKKGTSGVRKLVNLACLVREQQESPRDSCEDWEANRIQKSLSLILNSIAITSGNLLPFDRQMSFHFTDIYRYITPSFFEVEFQQQREIFLRCFIFFFFFWKNLVLWKFSPRCTFNFCLTLQWPSEFLCLRFFLFDFNVKIWRR